MPPATWRKRGRVADEDAAEDEYVPDQDNPETNPPPPKAKRKRTPKGKEMTVYVPAVYQSEKGHTILSKPWWREVTQHDDFWNDFEDNVLPSVINRRFKAHVQLVTTLPTRTAANPPRQAARSGTAGAQKKPESDQATLDSTQQQRSDTDPYPEPVICDTCKQPISSGNTEHHICLYLQHHNQEAAEAELDETATPEAHPQSFSTDKSPTVAQRLSGNTVEEGSFSSTPPLNPPHSMNPPARPAWKAMKGIRRDGQWIHFESKEMVTVKVEQDD